MKIALISDSHFGCRSDNPALLDHQKLFLDDIFFPYLKNHKIDTVFHLGDLVDRRKYINFNTLNRMRTDFIVPLSKIASQFYIIAGNHDVYYKDRNDVNALTELIGAYMFCKYFWEPTDIILSDNTKILMLPWICRANEEQSFKAIEDTKASVCFGHLQLQGFEMHKGTYAEEGYKKESFDKFSMVCTGHFHHKSSYNNIHYLGCPFQMNWGDYGDTKGFHVLDTQTMGLEFVENPYSLFHKIEYDDTNTTLDAILNKDFNLFKKSFVRVNVLRKTNPFWFDSFIEKLETVDPLSIQIIEDNGNLSFEGDMNDIIDVADTFTMLSNYCDSIGVQEVFKPKLKALFQTLYNEANTARNVQ